MFSFISPILKLQIRLFSCIIKKGYPWKTLLSFTGYKRAWLLIGFSLRDYHTNTQQSPMTTNFLPSVMQGVACDNWPYLVKCFTSFWLPNEGMLTSIVDLALKKLKFEIFYILGILPIEVCICKPQNINFENK